MIRKMIVLLVALMILAVAATPALAWEDEGGPNFTSGRCQTLATATTDRATDQDSDGTTIRFGTPEYPWALARAEGW